MQEDSCSVEGMVELNQFEVDDQVTKTNKLKGITELLINLDELNNNVNLKDGRPSNELLTYHVTDNKDFTCFEPDIPQYKKLKNGRPSNELLTCHVTDDKDFTHFEPQTPQYRKLKNGEFTSLNLRITDQNNNIITDGPQVTVVLYVRDRKI